MAGYIGSKASVVSSGAERKKTFAITGSTTSLTGCNYTVGKVHVFQNGVRLVDGTDYTATNGTTITLTVAAQSGDNVVVVSYASFQLSEHYTSAQADAEFVNDPNSVITVSGAVVTESANSATVEHTINNETSSGNRYSMFTFKDQGATKYYQYQNHNDGNVLFRNEHATGSLQFMTGGANERIRIDATGAVTMPTQPAFSATKSSKQSQVAVSSAVTVVFDTEVFDQNADFSSNTFTAPVTGKYQLNLSLYTNEIDSASDYYLAVIKTSNREYQNVIDPGVLASDPVYWNQGVSVLADMDANDTAYVFIQQGNGNQQTDVATPSFFSGYLVA